jgi:hypothetical protein
MRLPNLPFLGTLPSNAPLISRLERNLLGRRADQAQEPLHVGGRTCHQLLHHQFGLPSVASSPATVAVHHLRGGSSPPQVFAPPSASAARPATGFEFGNPICGNRLPSSREQKVSRPGDHEGLHRPGGNLGRGRTSGRSPTPQASATIDPAVRRAGEASRSFPPASSGRAAPFEVAPY